MKKSDEIRRKTWRMIAKNLIVLAALAVAAVIGVMSWFTNNKKATADNISVECRTPEGLEIAIVAPNGDAPEESDWVSGTLLLKTDDAKYNFLSNLTLGEITGDGLSFIKPPIIQESSAAKVDASADADWAANKIATTPNVEYISFDLYMRVHNTNQKVVFTTATYFGPENRNENFGNSISGWSPNSVIGAARLSVVDTESNRKLLWIPAPHLYYNGETLQTDVTDTSNNLGLFTVNPFGEHVTINTWGTYNHAYYKSNKTPERIMYSADPDEVGTNVTAGTNCDFMLPYEVSIATFGSEPEDDGYYYQHVRVNMWIEGEDTESRALQVGGEFVASLSLSLKSSV